MEGVCIVVLVAALLPCREPRGVLRAAQQRRQQARKQRRAEVRRALGHGHRVERLKILDDGLRERARGQAQARQRRLCQLGGLCTATVGFSSSTNLYLFLCMDWLTSVGPS